MNLMYWLDDPGPTRRSDDGPLPFIEDISGSKCVSLRRSSIKDVERAHFVLSNVGATPEGSGGIEERFEEAAHIVTG